MGINFCVIECVSHRATGRLGQSLAGDIHLGHQLPSRISRQVGALFLMSFATVVVLWADLSWADDCATTPVSFDGLPPMHYAVVTGDPGTRLGLHVQLPVGCESSSGGEKCETKGYLVQGDTVAVGKTCGAWSDVQFIGKKVVSYGWVATASLRGATANDAGEAVGQAHYKFSLKEGVGLPVCEAFLQRINRTTYVVPPYCKWNVPFDEATPGFRLISRRPMSAEELWPLIGNGYYFLLSQKPNARTSALRRYDQSGQLQYDPDYTLDFVKGFMAGVSGSGLDAKPWLYPGLDVENNGKPVDVMLWEGGILAHAICFEGWDPARIPGSSRHQAYAFILNEQHSDIDFDRTRVIFGSARNRAPSHRYRAPGHPFVPVGDDMDFFAYRNVVYFDSFLAFRDRVGARSSDRDQYQTLEVFQRSNGVTRPVCKYESTLDPYQMGSRKQ
jgi:hypothetical protein